MGGPIGVVGIAEVIPRDDEVGFGGKMRLTYEEGVDTVEI
jgi:hypothetical protein